MGLFGLGGFGNVGDAGGQQRDAAQNLANIAYQRQAEVGDAQGRTAGALSQYAMGMQPTAADWTARQQRDANMAAAQSYAAGARGGNVGLAQYQMGNQMAAANQAAARDATMANLAAQQQWWQMLQNQQQAQRQGELSAMGTQAGLAGQAQQGLAGMYGASQQAQAQALGAAMQGLGAVGGAAIGRWGGSPPKQG